jgi:hypothetical protein
MTNVENQNTFNPLEIKPGGGFDSRMMMEWLAVKLSGFTLALKRFTLDAGPTVKAYADQSL